MVADVRKYFALRSLLQELVALGSSKFARPCNGFPLLDFLQIGVDQIE